jgi:hypothetical protein
MVKEILELTEAEVRIVAHICGDGCLYSYTCKRTPSDIKTHFRKNQLRKVYSIKYCNTEKTLLNNFEKDVKSVYGLKTFFYRNEHQLRAKWVYERLKSFGAGKSKEWFIADEIMTAKKTILKEWLKAFFDDEAYVDIRNFRICLNSVNLNGLEQIQELLRKFNINDTKILGPYHYKQFYSYRLRLLGKDVERFRVYIGFNHPKKIEELEELLDLRELKL